MREFEAPQSRNEAILQNILGADNELLPPESRIETLLQLLLEELQGGSSEVVVDSALSATSTNPVQNKVIYDNVYSQLMGTMAGLNVNKTTGSMELYNKDLNTIKVSGFYNASNCTNAAFTYMTLLVIGYYQAGYCTQIATDVTNGNMKKRSQINGTWTAWSDL